MPLHWENIRIEAVSRSGVLPLVHQVDLSLKPGQTHALVGESGSGKSLTALAALRLLPPFMRIHGRITFEHTDVLAMTAGRLSTLRGNRVAMIFQEPMSCLNPAMTIGGQIVEALEIHRKSASRAARQAGVELLARVGISDPSARFDAYPHEISGGMRQRVMIAIAIACRPTVLIADEPTTALDVTVQAQILALLAELQRDTGMAILFITHDLAVVARIADETSVMYAGRIVESAPTAALLATPRHPYTRALLRCVPRLQADESCRDETEVRQSLPTIRGDIPRAGAMPPGCAFEPRCDVAGGDTRCRNECPDLQDSGSNRVCACWKPL